MGQYTAARFAKTVARDYEARRSSLLTERSLNASARPQIEARALGHPDFEDLQVGQRRSCRLACVFIDLSDFTGRSFWDPADQVVDLAHAVLTGFIEAVSVFGGFALGLRGDGLFAGFGSSSRAKNEAVDSIMALAACAVALDGVQTEVNPWLRQRGIHPVQARAGLDYGEITFVRTGSAENNEVNPLGFAANFAAKCEKAADAWEIVIGQSLAANIPDATLLTEHEKSPKTYQRDYKQERYRFYRYRWRSSLKYLPAAAQQLDGRPTSSITVH